MFLQIDNSQVGAQLNKMPYDIKDARQAMLGAIIASLLVVIIRTGQPITINPIKGFIVGIIWIAIVTMPYITRKRTTKVHALGNVIITLTVTTVLSLTFDLMTIQQLTIQGFTGSSAWIIMMLSLPTATFFDRMNIINLYDRWYFRKGK